MIVTCPVCRRVAGDDELCVVCRWRLSGEYVLGDVTPRRQREFEAGLSAAQRQLDLAAVARAASAYGRADPELAARLTGFARGDPNPAPPGPAPEDFRPPAAAPPGVQPDVAAALHNLAERKSEELLFVGVGPDGIGWARVEVGVAGLPEITAARHLGGWASLGAQLAADQDLCLFQLAGGVGRAPDDGPITADRGLAVAASAAIEPGAFAARAGVVLVRRAVGLPLLDRVTDELRWRWRPLAEVLAPGRSPLAEVVTGLLASAPLRDPVVLLVALVDRGSGRVRLGARPLFPAGGLPGADGGRSGLVAVTADQSGSGQVCLPVAVARGGDRDDWPVLATGQVALAPGRQARVGVSLAPSGAVSFASPATVIADPGEDRFGRDVRAQLPAELPLVKPVDVVCAVELGGDTEAAEERIEFVAALIEVLAKRIIPGTPLRVGLVGVEDHDPWEPERPPAACPLTTPDQAAAELRRWRPAGTGLSLAAPLEDALAVAVGLGWAQARRVLLMFFARPPHPARSCSAGHDWEDLLARERNTRQIEVFVAVEQARWKETLAAGGSREWAERAWAVLGQDGLGGLIERDDLPADEVLKKATLIHAEPPISIPLGVVDSDQNVTSEVMR